MTTNREQLNQMSNEELARFITLYTDCSYCCAKSKCTPDGSCLTTFIKWLNQESEENNDMENK